MVQPEAGVDCVASTKSLAEYRQRPYTERRPVVCLGDSAQLVLETSPLIVSTKQQPFQVDDEYERAATVVAIQFCEPKVPRRPGAIDLGARPCQHPYQGALYVVLETPRARTGTAPRVLPRPESRPLAEDRGV